MLKEHSLWSRSSMKKPLAIYSLKRSKLRRKITEYLINIDPSCSYASEIAENVNTSPSYVKGAIHGMGSRFREEDSLLKLNIVELKPAGENLVRFGVTPFGKEIFELVRNR